MLGSVERQGKWALGYYDREIELSRIVRVSLDGSSDIEEIYRPDPPGWVCLPRANPRYDVCHIRFFLCETPRAKPLDKPGQGNLKCHCMMIVGTDGSDPHPVSNDNEWHHHCWSGDGEWYMLGARKKRWNARPEDPWQPIAKTGGWGFNHIGVCGRDGKFLVGDYGNIYTYIYDLEQERRFLMNALISSSLPYSKNGDPHPTGSPDGTKYVFDSIYDLENCPITRLTRQLSEFDEIIMVESTEGFAESGKLVLAVPAAELVSYEHKGPNRFYGCKRGLLPEPIGGDHPNYNGAAPAQIARPSIAAVGNAVVPAQGLSLKPGRPRRPDVYVQVIRPPALPRGVRATRTGSQVNLQWGKPHCALEIAAYRVWRNDGEQWQALAQIEAESTSWIDGTPPSQAATYTVSSIEHSGLESERSASAAVASVDGKSLPPTIIFPAESGQYLPPDQHTKPYARMRSHHDDQAYNYRAVECKDCENPLSWVFDMPAEGRYTVMLSLKALAKPAQVALSANGQSCRTTVDADEFTWLSMSATTYSLLAALRIVKGRNQITVSAPIGSVLVDCVRLELAKS